MPYVERKDKDGKVLDRYFTTQQPKKKKARKEAGARTIPEKKK